MGKPRLRTRQRHIGNVQPQKPGDWSPAHHERAANWGRNPGVTISHLAASGDGAGPGGRCGGVQFRSAHSGNDCGGGGAVLRCSSALVGTAARIRLAPQVMPPVDAIVPRRRGNYNVRRALQRESGPFY